MASSLKRTADRRAFTTPTSSQSAKAPAKTETPTSSSVKRRVLLLVALMAVVAVAVAGISIWTLYRAALKVEEARLIDTAKSQARLIEAVARYQRRSAGIDDDGAQAATVGQIVDAFRHFKRFGRTGEFVVARREGEMIVFLPSRQHTAPDSVLTILWSSPRAASMRRA